MKTVLDDGYTWFLEAISYQGGSLAVRVVEGMRTSGPEDLAVGGLVLQNTYAIGTMLHSRRVTIRFDRLVAWQCVNESFTAFDEYEVGEGEGALREMTRSRYLDYVNGSHGFYADVVGPAKHYRIWTENEVIDVVAFDPPSLEVVQDGAGAAGGSQPN